MLSGVVQLFLSSFFLVFAHFAANSGNRWYCGSTVVGF